MTAARPKAAVAANRCCLQLPPLAPPPPPRPVAAGSCCAQDTPAQRRLGQRSARVAPQGSFRRLQLAAARGEHPPETASWQADHLAGLTSDLLTDDCLHDQAAAQTVALFGRRGGGQLGPPQRVVPSVPLWTPPAAQHRRPATARHNGYTMRTTRNAPAAPRTAPQPAKTRTEVRSRSSAGLTARTGSLGPLHGRHQEQEHHGHRHYR